MLSITASPSQPLLQQMSTVINLILRFLHCLLGCCRLRGPIAVSELMHFFLATHESINDPSKADKLDSASFDQPLKRVKTEAAVVPPVASTPQAQTQHAEQSQVNTACLTPPPSTCYCLDKGTRQGSTWSWIMTNDNVWRMTAGSGHPDCVEEPRWH